MSGQTVEQVALAPQNTQSMSEADCAGKSGTRGRGPFMVIHLCVSSGVITDASCQTYGCPAAIACGSKVTEWVKGKSPSEAAKLTEAEVRGWFVKFPLGKRHCARIAVAALRDAVGNYPAPDGVQRGEHGMEH